MQDGWAWFYDKRNEWDKESLGVELVYDISSKAFRVSKKGRVVSIGVLLKMGGVKSCLGRVWDSHSY